MKHSISVECHTGDLMIQKEAGSPPVLRWRPFNPSQPYYFEPLTASTLAELQKHVRVDGRIWIDVEEIEEACTWLWATGKQLGFI